MKFYYKIMGYNKMRKETVQLLAYDHNDNIIGETDGLLTKEEAIETFRNASGFRVANSREQKGLIPGNELRFEVFILEFIHR